MKRFRWNSSNNNPSLIYPITLPPFFRIYRRKKERKKERSYSLRESLSLSLSSNESALSYLSAILWIHAWMAKRVAWNIFNGKTFHLLLRQREPHLWDRRRISIRYYWFRARNTEDSVSSSSYFHIQHPLPTTTSAWKTLGPITRRVAGVVRGTSIVTFVFVFVFVFVLSATL